MALGETNDADNGTRLIGDANNAQNYQNDYVIQVKTHPLSGRIAGIKSFGGGGGAVEYTRSAK